MGISVVGALPPAGAKEKRMVLFTATGSWTAPAGVTYAIAHIVGGGGGGGGKDGGGGGGGASSFDGVTYNGGRGAPQTGWIGTNGFAGAANTGQGGSGGGGFSYSGNAPAQDGADSAVRQQGFTVSPGTSYTVTVGAGGSGGGGGNVGGAGGSGYVSIEFYV